MDISTRRRTCVPLFLSLEYLLCVCQTDLAASTSPVLAQLARAEQQAAEAREETARVVSEMRLRIKAESDALHAQVRKETEEMTRLLEQREEQIAQRDREIEGLRHLLEDTQVPREKKPKERKNSLPCWPEGSAGERGREEGREEKETKRKEEVEEGSTLIHICLLGDCVDLVRAAEFSRVRAGECLCAFLLFVVRLH